MKKLIILLMVLLLLVGTVSAKEITLPTGQVLWKTTWWEKIKFQITGTLMAAYNPDGSVATSGTLCEGTYYESYDGSCKMQTQCGTSTIGGCNCNNILKVDASHCGEPADGDGFIACSRDSDCSLLLDCEGTQVERCIYPGTTESGCICIEQNIQPEECIDTDGGKVYDVEGVITVGGVPEAEDICISNTQLKEYYCNPDESFSSTTHTCSSGEECSNYACVPITGGCSPGDKRCSITDGYYEECKSDRHWESGYYCGTNYECSGGDCIYVEPSITCEDSDGGKIYGVVGITKEIEGGVPRKTETDSCVSSTKLKEYYCSGNLMSSIETLCETGEECVGGACVEEEGPIVGAWTLRIFNPYDGNINTVSNPQPVSKEDNIALFGIQSADKIDSIQCSFLKGSYKSFIFNEFEDGTYINSIEFTIEDLHEPITALCEFDGISQRIFFNHRIELIEPVVSDKIKMYNEDGSLNSIENPQPIESEGETIISLESDFPIKSAYCPGLPSGSSMGVKDHGKTPEGLFFNSINIRWPSTYLVEGLTAVDCTFEDVDTTIYLLSTFKVVPHSPVKAYKCETIQDRGGMHNLIFYGVNMDEETFDARIKRALTGIYMFEPIKSNRNTFNEYKVFADKKIEFEKDGWIYDVKSSDSTSLNSLKYICPVKGTHIFLVGTYGRGERVGDYARISSREMFIFIESTDHVQYEEVIVAHEFGHAFGELDDEYIYKQGQKPQNVPYNCDLKDCPSWSKWYKRDCFEGCTHNDYYRSSKNSLMRYHESGDGFNTVSQKLINEKKFSASAKTMSILKSTQSIFGAEYKRMIFLFKKEAQTIILESLYFDEGESEDKRTKLGHTNEYQLKIFSKSESELYSTYFIFSDYSFAPLAEWFDEEGNQIYFPEPKASDTVLFTTPYFKDIGRVDVYDAQDNLVLSEEVEFGAVSKIKSYWWIFLIIIIIFIYGFWEKGPKRGFFKRRL